MISIKEIAKLAGVSRGTVDRVINQRGRVSKETTEKINALIKEYGYYKNQNASSLAKNKDLIIAIIFPDPKSDDYWAFTERGIESQRKFVLGYGIKLIYFYFDLLKKESFELACNLALQEIPDGVLMSPKFDKEARMFTQLASHNNIPIVCVDTELQNENIFSFIGQDAVKSGILAARLFDFSKNEIDIIYSITIGDNCKDALAIQQKNEGLKTYFSDKNGMEVKLFFLSDNSEDGFKKLSDEIINTKREIGLFFTNSKAYQFMNTIPDLKLFMENCLVIGYDLIPANVKLLRNNKLDIILYQNAFLQGQKGVLTLFNYLERNLSASPINYLPTEVIFKENLESYLGESSFLTMDV